MADVVYDKRIIFEMKKPKIKIETLGGNKVLIVDDEETGLTSISLIANGGPIVSAATEMEAKVNFIQAMTVAESVRKLRYFKKHGKFPK